MRRRLTSYTMAAILDNTRLALVVNTRILMRVVSLNRSGAVGNVAPPFGNTFCALTHCSQCTPPAFGLTYLNAIGTESVGHSLSTTLQVFSTWECSPTNLVLGSVER